MIHDSMLFFIFAGWTHCNRSRCHQGTSALPPASSCTTRWRRRALLIVLRVRDEHAHLWSYKSERLQLRVQPASSWRRCWGSLESTQTTDWSIFLPQVGHTRSTNHQLTTRYCHTIRARVGTCHVISGLAQVSCNSATQNIDSIYAVGTVSINIAHND